jgi:hypothetical protein
MDSDKKGKQLKASLLITKPREVRKCTYVQHPVARNCFRKTSFTTISTRFHHALITHRTWLSMGCSWCQSEAALLPRTPMGGRGEEPQAGKEEEDEEEEKEKENGGGGECRGA